MFKCDNCGNEEYGSVEDNGGIFIICKKCGFVEEAVPRNVEISENLQRGHIDENNIFYECPICREGYKNGTSECNVCGYSANVKDERKVQNMNVNTPKCPICQSTNLTKLSTTKKVAKIATFGILGMGDSGKTWKCNNCGSKF